MKRIHIVLLIVILIGTATLRLYHLTRPVADWHSWRQADTAAVARNFIKFGFDPLRPRSDDLSNIPSGLDNPMGWRMVEFPLYQSIGMLFFKLVPQIPIEVWLRLVTIAASTGTVLILALLVGSILSPDTGLIAALVYGILPYSIYYGRTILPDTFMVFLAMFTILLMYYYFQTRKLSWLVLSACTASLALLVKPVAAFLLLPVGYLFWRREGVSAKLFVYGLLMAAIALAPFLLWRQWITHFPEGIPAFWWLFNSNHIRLKGAWFHWLFAERIGNLILGYWGLIPFGIGLMRAPLKREGWIFRWLLIGSLAYLVVLATGNVQHDYYQILIVPVIAIYVAKGWQLLFDSPFWKRETGEFHRLSFVLLTVVCLAFSLSFSWFTIRTYYWINHQEIVDAGRAADTIIPKDAKVIAPYNGDTTFLYQTNRQGWPIGFDIDKKIKMGATHYVTVSPTDADLETKELASKYTVLVRNSEFAIIDLTKPVR